MEPLNTMIVLVLIAGCAGIGYWAHRIGRAPVPFILLAVFGSPILAAVVLVVLGPSLGKRDVQLEDEQIAVRQQRNKNREELISSMIAEDRTSFADEAYVQAWKELENDDVNPVAMARATAASNGQEEHIRSNYLKIRVEKLLDKRALQIRDSFPLEIDENESPTTLEIVDASGKRKTITANVDGTFSLETMFGEMRVFQTLDDAKRYLRG